ncbi:hypothetical protein J1N35_042046 [Gossypium stocksii]|uniref:RNase H type-1 domain-containing protein n=1 Tax=Gossypium stocksii TaxID=47602 RepID=A0A9D3ZJY8_9ROSI|nr:hypothetical protein J1N35_042046 [Gossypium stocksii]
MGVVWWEGLFGIRQLELHTRISGLLEIRGFRLVEIESDNALLIEVVRNGCASNNDSSEVLQIHQLCRMLGENIIEQRIT